MYIEISHSDNGTSSFSDSNHEGQVMPGEGITSSAIQRQQFSGNAGVGQCHQPTLLQQMQQQQFVPSQSSVQQQIIMQQLQQQSSSSAFSTHAKTAASCYAPPVSCYAASVQCHADDAAANAYDALLSTAAGTAKQ